MKTLIILATLAVFAACTKTAEKTSNSVQNTAQPSNTLKESTIDLPVSKFSIESLSKKHRAEFDTKMPPDLRKVIDRAEKVEIFAYEREESGGKRRQLSHMFIANRVALINETEVIKNIRNSFYEDLFMAGEQAACWAPRHAIVFFSDGREFEFTICFECSGFKGAVSGKIRAAKESKLLPLLDILIERQGKEIG